VSTFAALVAYDGTRFAGYARQVAERGPTVQGALEEAIWQTSGERVTIVAAGRTDSGVHASGQVISFASAARLGPGAWQRALNARLPADVAARAVIPVADSFHARRDALARSYRYRILIDPVRDPLAERFAWRVARALDAAAMHAAAALLLGEHDFAAFGSSPRDDRATGYRGHTVRTLFEASCRQVGEHVDLAFSANAFLTGMVRRLVGALTLVGEGRLSGEGFREIFEAREKGHLGAAAPARGLCLVGVRYPPELVTWPEAALSSGAGR
jgi:tRNA pseudouridine38-40 synthase